MSTPISMPAYFDAASLGFSELRTLADCLESGNFSRMESLLADMPDAKPPAVAQATADLLPSFNIVLAKFAGMALEGGAEPQFSDVVDAMSLLRLSSSTSLEELFSQWLDDALGALTGDAPLDVNDAKWSPAFLKDAVQSIYYGWEYENTHPASPCTPYADTDSDSESESDISGCYSRASSAEVEDLLTIVPGEAATSPEPGDAADVKASCGGDRKVQPRRWELKHFDLFASAYAVPGGEAKVVQDTRRDRRVRYPGDHA